MDKAKLRDTLETISKEKGISVQEVYQKMQESIDMAQRNPDPMVQARWKLIPRKGEKVTVEEFLEYCVLVLSPSTGFQ